MFWGTSIAGSAPRRDDLEVGARYHHRAVLRDVELLDERENVALERLGLACIERRERLVDGPVDLAEKVNEMPWRAVAEREQLAHCRDVGVLAEEADKVLLRSP